MWDDGCINGQIPGAGKYLLKKLCESLHLLNTIYLQEKMTII